MCSSDLHLVNVALKMAEGRSVERLLEGWEAVKHVGADWSGAGKESRAKRKARGCERRGRSVSNKMHGTSGCKHWFYREC